MFVPPRATPPSSDVSREESTAAEGATPPAGRVVQQTEVPSPAALAPSAEAQGSVSEVAAAGGGAPTAAADAGALLKQISERAANALGDAVADAASGPVVPDATSLSSTRESSVVEAPRDASTERSMPVTAAESSDASAKDADAVPSRETTPSRTLEVPWGERAADIASDALETSVSGTSEHTGTAKTSIPGDTRSAHLAETPPITNAPESSLGKGAGGKAPSVEDSAEETLVDPYVANILAVLRGEANQPSPPALPSSPDAQSESRPPVSRSDAKQVGPPAPSVSSAPNELSQTMKSGPAAEPAGQAAAAPAVAVAAASKDRDVKEDSSAPIAAASSTSAASQADQAESVLTSPADAEIQAVRQAAASSLGAQTTESESASSETEPTSPASAVESAVGSVEVDVASGGANASPAGDPAPTARAEVTDTRRETLNAEDDRLRRTGDPVRDAAVREVRRARPLPPELAKRLAEARSTSDATSSAAKPAEPPTAAPSEPPNESTLASDPAPVNPMLWLERLREAAKIEAAGGRERYREAQARSASESPQRADAPADSTLGAESTATPSASKPRTATTASGAPGATAQGARASTTQVPGVASSAPPGATPVAAASRGRHFVPPVASSPGAAVEQTRVGPSTSREQDSAPRLDEDLAHAIDATPPASLGEPARAFLRPLLGIDPASVTVHEGVDAGAAADARKADALAVGERIVAPPASTTSDTPESLGLLAHELTHVARQRTPSFIPPLLREAPSPSEGLAGGARPLPNAPFVPPSASSGEEEIALAAERAVRHVAREEQRPSTDAGATAPIVPSARVWNPGEAPSVSGESDASDADSDPFGGFPAPNEPLVLPSSWHRSEVAPSLSTAAGRSGSARGDSLGSMHDFSGGDVSPAVQTAPSGRSVEHSGESSTPEGSKHSEGHEDGEHLDRLAAQVYQVLRRRLLAERRRGS